MVSAKGLRGKMKRYNTYLKKTKYEGTSSAIRESKKGNLVEYEEASNLLLEAYKAIVENQVSTSEIDGDQTCTFCGNGANEDHEISCMVLKSQSYIDSREGVKCDTKRV